MCVFMGYHLAVHDYYFSVQYLYTEVYNVFSRMTKSIYAEQTC